MIIHDAVFWWGAVFGVCLFGLLIILLGAIVTVFATRYAKPVHIPPVHRPDNE